LGLSLLVAAAGPVAASPVPGAFGLDLPQVRRAAQLSSLVGGARSVQAGDDAPDADEADRATAADRSVDAAEFPGLRLVVTPVAVAPDPPAAPSVTLHEADLQADTPYRSGLSGSDLDARLAGIVGLARTLVGADYVWGGTTPAGFDCSGFTRYVYDRVAIELPRSAEEQYHALNKIGRAEARPGDLVFFPRSDGFVYHTAIYLGDGMIAEARNPRVGVLIDPVWAANVSYGTVRDVGRRPGGFLTGRNDPTPIAATVGFDILPWAGGDYSQSVSTSYSALSPLPTPPAPTSAPTSGSVPRPAATPTPPTPSATVAPTTPVPSATGEPSPTPSATAAPTQTDTAEPTSTPTATAAPTPTVTAAPTPTVTAEPTPTPTVTATPAEPAVVTSLRLKGSLTDADGDGATTLSAALGAEDALCLADRPVSFAVSSDGASWTHVGTSASSAAGAVFATWSHDAALAGVRIVQATAEATERCAAASAEAFAALGTGADQFVGAGSDSAGPRARFAFRIPADDLAQGEFRWSGGELRLVASVLTDVEPVTCPAGFSACAVVRGEAATERWSGGEWTPDAPVAFAATIRDGADGDAFGLRVESSTPLAEGPDSTALTVGGIVAGEGFHPAP